MNFYLHAPEAQDLSSAFGTELITALNKSLQVIRRDSDYQKAVRENRSWDERREAVRRLEPVHAFWTGGRPLLPNAIAFLFPFPLTDLLLIPTKEGEKQLLFDHYMGGSIRLNLWVGGTRVGIHFYGTDTPEDSLLMPAAWVEETLETA